MRKVGGHDRPVRQILDFQEAVNMCFFIDLRFQGPRYTWNNNRDNDANIQGRLDRVLATSAWLDYFPMYTVSHFMGSISDHLALVVNTNTGQGVQRRKKVVRRFEEKWAR
jgi:hypothetical protein